RPNVRIVVTGCAAQLNPEMFADMEEVDRVVGNLEKLEAATLLGGPDDGTILVSDINEVRETAGHLVTGLEGRTRAFVLIQQGCDNDCTFCVIPAARGPNRSVPMQRIVDQVKTLVATGHLEVVLTGVDIASYGADIGLCDAYGTGLTQVIRRILDACPDLKRLRLSSLDPARLDRAFFELLATEPRLMPHLHLSLQAADDMVLKRMKRRHEVADIANVIATARVARPDVVFGADLIAGFPTETDGMFETTLRHVEDWDIAYLHVFPYSARPGTPAADMPQVPGDVAKERARKLREAGDRANHRHIRSLVKTHGPVLMETERDGRTESFAPVKMNDPFEPGAVVDAYFMTDINGVLQGKHHIVKETSAWVKKLSSGLGKSKDNITANIAAVFSAKRRLDDDLLEQLEEALIVSDMGVSTAARLGAELAKTRYDQEVSEREVREAFARHIAEILKPVARPLSLAAGRKPHVILMCGVNGSGKTTTTGKMAKQFLETGKTVMLVAGDTFRAAAVEQLQVWGERTGAPVIARQIGADAAGLCFDALTEARAKNIDVLMIDTAGRLQNKKDLMAELEKIVRVIKKIDASAPHDVLLVLDATIGQNAHAQVETFRDMVGVTGLVMTKLDGTAKGGVVVALADKFGLPVHAVGVGEAIDDLRPFDATDFARNLMGVDGE
ncbi:MAG: signal recognition particle-docking protein FtsY, partial [Alphaproteobacteria bacterium]|nr:signal recognition particle-docking protein FtsY [Alphaproteobacteria bacterium]